MAVSLLNIRDCLLLLWASLVAQRLKCLTPMQETRVRSLCREDPLEKEMATHSSILAWRIPGTGAWGAAVYGVAQSQTQLKRLSSSSSSTHIIIVYLPRRLSGKESACNAGDTGSIPGSGRSPGEGNGNPLQYYCLGNPMDRGAWGATVMGLQKSWT